MVDLWVGDVLLVDTAGVGFEHWSCLDSTADGTMGVDLGLHRVSTSNTSVLRDKVFGAVLWAAVLLKSFVKERNWWYTGLAGLHSVTGELVGVERFVLLTGVVTETVGVSELVDSGWVSTVA